MRNWQKVRDSMREILYKAKRIDTGEWVVGSLIQTSYFRSIRSWISSEQEDKARLREISSNQAVWRAFEVRNDTICQCTGLKDKNGKLIWENDIVKATVRQNSLCQSSSYSDFYQVAYHEKYCYFYLKKKNNNLLFDGNWSYYLKSIEVIGNIFDNKELLESEG